MKNVIHRPALRAIAKRGSVLVAILATTTVTQACPMCKDSCPVDPNSKIVTADNSTLSFNKSIYFMLGGLVSVAGFTGRVMYKTVRSSK